MIGSLMYLIASRPDIMFVVCACPRFQVTQKTSHLHVGKRIFRYLKGQYKLGLWYPRDSPFELEAFFDSDYAEASLDRKSTTGGKGFSGIITPLFDTMMVQATEEVGEGSERKETEVPDIEPQIEESVPTPSNDPLPSGEDRMQLSELVEFYTKLSNRFLSLEKIKTNQAAKIEKLKKRVKKLEGKKKKRTHGLKRLYKVGLSSRIVSSDKEGLGDQEDASKQGRIAEIDADENLSLIDETTQDQGRLNEEEMFSVDDLDGDEVKEKGKGIMVEPEKPLKKKEQIIMDEEVARKLEAQVRAEIEEEERIVREKDEANIALIEEWDDVQATINADRQLAKQLEAQEREQLSIKE
nr:putative ribonuclease H-like domain-containing protein [Tanacetum cinerariifolium]